MHTAELCPGDLKYPALEKYKNFVERSGKVHLQSLYQRTYSHCLEKNPFPSPQPCTCSLKYTVLTKSMGGNLPNYCLFLWNQRCLYSRELPRPEFTCPPLQGSYDHFLTVCILRSLSLWNRFYHFRALRAQSVSRIHRLLLKVSLVSLYLMRFSCILQCRLTLSFQCSVEFSSHNQDKLKQDL